MSKRNRAEQRAQQTKKHEGACLHCAFLKLHHEKWPEWKSDDDSPSGKVAFNDLVRSTVKIVAEVFTMLDPQDQMQFMHMVMTTYKASIGEINPLPQSPEEIKEIKELVEIFRRQSEPTKH
jgi:hypothetical protein